MATFDTCRRRLEQMRARALDGAARGLDKECESITQVMRATQAHGDDTGATRASYNARRVGRGQTGAGVVGSLQSLVNILNPGHVGDSSITIAGDLGVIIDSQTDYQEKLETENAGARAVLGPTLAGEARNLTRAVADGSKAALR